MPNNAKDAAEESLASAAKKSPLVAASFIIIPALCAVVVYLFSTCDDRARAAVTDCDRRVQEAREDARYYRDKYTELVNAFRK